MAITILAIGKRHEPWVADGISRYQQRLRAPFSAEWVFLPHSNFEGDRARQEESERLHTRLKQDDFVIVLDERGTMVNSPDFSALLAEQFTTSRPIVVVIGGAYGVDDTVRARAQAVWSLSPLVFPHQLVRLILVEQLYRAQQIQIGSAYHHQ